MTEPGWSANGSLTFGSWGRNDQIFDAKAGNPDFYARIGATRSDSDNYEDGDGKEVHSFYTRWSTTGALGWTPDDNTLLELSFGRSDGEAAYADRGMDGTKFEREHVGVKFDKRNALALGSAHRGERLLQLHRPRDGQLQPAAEACDCGLLRQQPGPRNQGRALRRPP